MKQEQVSERANQSLIDQAGQLAGTPLMDPQKNPQIAEQAAAALENINQQIPPQQ